MKKLNKERQARLEALRNRAGDAFVKVERAVEHFNSALAANRETLERIIAEYDEVGEEIADFMAEIHDEQQDYYNERSETWMDSDAGGAYQEWMDAWDNQIEPFIDTIEFPDEIPSVDDALTEILDNLPVEPG